MEDEPERDFEGVFVSHWEVPRFCVVSGRRFFGFLPRVEKWEAIFPEGFELPEWRDLVAFGQSPGRCYRMRVRGRLGPKGHFGHKGMCSRELHISRVISWEETDDPGPTW